MSLKYFIFKDEDNSIGVLFRYNLRYEPKHVLFRPEDKRGIMSGTITPKGHIAKLSEEERERIARQHSEIINAIFDAYVTGYFNPKNLEERLKSVA